MEEKHSPQGEETPGGVNDTSYTPASFEKRAAAWMGIVYVLMVFFIFTFAIYTGGRELPGTFPLLLVPVSVTLAVVLIRQLKNRCCPAGTMGGVIGLIACAAGMFFGLALGVPALIAAFQR